MKTFCMAAVLLPAAWAQTGLRGDVQQPVHRALVPTCPPVSGVLMIKHASRAVARGAQSARWAPTNQTSLHEKYLDALSGIPVAQGNMTQPKWAGTNYTTCTNFLAAAVGSLTSSDNTSTVRRDAPCMLCCIGRSGL
jgi:hypothetical protein